MNSSASEALMNGLLDSNASAVMSVVAGDGRSPTPCDTSQSHTSPTVCPRNDKLVSSSASMQDSGAVAECKTASEPRSTLWRGVLDSGANAAAASVITDDNTSTAVCDTAQSTASRSSSPELFDCDSSAPDRLEPTSASTISCDISLPHKVEPVPASVVSSTSDNLPTPRRCLGEVTSAADRCHADSNETSYSIHQTSASLATTLAQKLASRKLTAKDGVNDLAGTTAGQQQLAGGQKIAVRSVFIYSDIHYYLYLVFFTWLRLTGIMPFV